MAIVMLGTEKICEQICKLSVYSFDVESHSAFMINIIGNLNNDYANS